MIHKSRLVFSTVVTTFQPGDYTNIPFAIYVDEFFIVFTFKVFRLSIYLLRYLLLVLNLNPLKASEPFRLDLRLIWRSK